MRAAPPRTRVGSSRARPIGRYRGIQGDTGRFREIWGDVGGGLREEHAAEAAAHPLDRTCERVGTQILSLGLAFGVLAGGFEGAGAAAQEEGERAGPWLWQGWPCGAAAAERGRRVNRLEGTAQARLHRVRVRVRARVRVRVRARVRVRVRIRVRVRVGVRGRGRRRRP